MSQTAVPRSGQKPALMESMLALFRRPAWRYYSKEFPTSGTLDEMIRRIEFLSDWGPFEIVDAQQSFGNRTIVGFFYHGAKRDRPHAIANLNEVLAPLNAPEVTSEPTRRATRPRRHNQNYHTERDYHNAEQRITHA